MATRQPRRAFALASVLDRLGAAAGYHPSFFRRGLMHLELYHGARASLYPEIICNLQPQSIPPPAILLSLHLGAVEAVGALLAQLPAEVACLVDRPWPARGSLRHLPIGGGEWERVRATHQALATLRGGGFMFAAADGAGQPRIKVALGEGCVSLARGVFELSHRYGFPLRPVLTRWHGRRVQITVGAELTAGGPEELAAAFMRVVAEYLALHDDHALRWRINRMLLAADTHGVDAHGVRLSSARNSP